jgi:hypothetical protein
MNSIIRVFLTPKYSNSTLVSTYHAYCMYFGRKRGNSKKRVVSFVLSNMHALYGVHYVSWEKARQY